MELRYNWRTKLFSRKFDIYQNDILKGELCKESWSRNVNGELNVRRIMFETKGVFKYETTIIDLQGEIEIGKINFSLRKAKTTILYKNKEYRWQFDNFIKSKWSLSDENGVIIRYHSRAFSGLIVSYTRDEILILAGFFIRNLLKQRYAKVAAAS
ncbi:MAG: hypothetical protein E4H43_03410 [Bacteroidia bacterium]|nr:MAG: hypothetical protein E4H43_03410 [Bacteroidia bacterium]